MRAPTPPRLRIVFIGLGSLCVGLGALGVFLPILPTTPFLLLAAAAYLRGSERFHHWLVTHPILGRYISYYRSGHGMPLAAKILTIAVLWISIALSILAVPRTSVRLALGAVAIGVTVFVSTRRAPRPAGRRET